MTETPITHRDGLWNARRTFVLFDDRVEVTLKSQHLDAQETVRFSDLRPEIERLRMRQAVPFKVGVVFVVTGLIALLASWLRPDLSKTFNLIPGSVGLLIPGVAVLAFFGRKVEIVRFRSPVRLIRLEIVRSGPDKSRFESFVTTLQSRIASERPPVRPD